MRRSQDRVTIALLLATLAGCAGGGGASERTTTEQTTTAEPSQQPLHSADARPAVLPGTPPGGLEEWIGDVRTGLDAQVKPLSRSAPPKALEAAVGLYVTRQEYIERYYEAGQPLYAGDALAEAVKQAETRFHELMQVLQQRPLSAASVDSAADRLEAQYRRVLDEARSAGARLTPRSAEARRSEERRS